MKRILALTIGLLAATVVNAAAFDIPYSRWNAGNTALQAQLPAHPTCAAGGVFYFNTTTNLANWPCVEGLELVGTTLRVVKADWNAMPSALGGIQNKPNFAAVAFSGQATDLMGMGATGMAVMLAATVPDAHTVLGASSVGVSLYQAVDQAAARTAISAPSSADLSAGLSGKLNTPVGTTGQYLRGDGSTATFPSLGTASPLNAPTSGNAASGEVVLGSDTRLTDTRLPTGETATGTVLRTASSAGAALTALDGVSTAGLTSALGSYATTSALTSGLAGKADTVHTHAASDIVSGTLADARIPALAISKTTGLQAAIDAKLATPAGTTSQVVLGNGTLGTLPTGTVTSVTAGTGLSGGVITSTGTISLPNTGSAGTYNASVTTDAQGRVTAGATLSINDAPGRTLVTTTASTGFQISSTRVARVCYEGAFSTTSTIGGPATATVFLETADTNSTTPGDWTTKARQTYSNNITLAIVLNQVQVNNWTLCRDIPAAKFVRLRAGSVSGTASASINSEQQETLQ